MREIRHALRQLVLRPGLSLVIVVMLALGIGATTAMFSSFHRVLVQPLPVPAAERLVNLRAPGPIRPGPIRTGNAVSDWESTFSYPMFRDLEAQQTVFTSLAAHRDFQANITYAEQTRGGRGLLVSGSYFDVLRLQPALGRLIGPRDEPRAGESAVAVLAYDYWRSRFGGDPSIIGRTLTVNGRALSIVGVAPAGFAGTTLGWRPQVFVPLTLRWLMQPTAIRDQQSRQSYWLYLFARLKPNVTIEQASASINGSYGALLRDVEAAQLDALSGEERAQFLAQRIVLEPGARGQSEIPGTAARPLTLLLGITVLVLLIVCVNVAHLLLARGAARSGEMAVRASVGASRGRLALQLLAESGLLAALGGGLSLPVAVVTLKSITALIPQPLADGLAVDLDAAAVLFAAGASAATVLLFGAAPAWRTSDADPGRVIKGQTPQSAGGRSAARFRRVLGTAQIAFSLVLLVIAGLFTQSLANVARVKLGMDVDSLVTFNVSPRLNGYAPDQVDALYDRIEDTLAAQPGVTNVATAGIPVIANAGMNFFVSIDGAEPVLEGNAGSQSNVVSPGFFETLSIPLLAGRDFREADIRDSARSSVFVSNVAIVNEAFVRKFDLGHALGRHFSIPFVADDLQIIGVVGDAKYVRIKDDMRPQFFTPGRQLGDDTSLSFYVRGAIDAETLTAMIPRIVASIDPSLPVDNVATMRQQVASNVYIDRLVTMLSASFAALATLLAAIGLYGVLAYNVAQRTGELGLRLALGADPRHLRAIVLKQVGSMALSGATLGLIAAIGVGRAAQSLLFGLSGHDPAVLFAAVAVLSAVVAAAGYVPARRASSIAPMRALRYG
jgi:putative ABC transport system permease protein